MHTQPELVEVLAGADHHADTFVQSVAGGLEYLVKWVDLGYDECTWEEHEDLKPFTPKFEQYERQQALEEERASLGFSLDCHPLDALRVQVAHAQRDAAIAKQQVRPMRVCFHRGPEHWQVKSENAPHQLTGLHRVGQKSICHTLQPVQTM